MSVPTKDEVNAVRASNRGRLRWVLATMALLTANRIRAEAAGAGTALPGGEPAGSDVFVTAREGLLRDKPSGASRIVGKLPGGSRVRLLKSGERYVRVEMEGGVGFLSRDSVCFFGPDERATAELLAAGRALSGSPPHRRLAVAFLLRGSERLRAGSPGNPAVEVLLGETAEALAAVGGPFPPGLSVAREPGPPPRWVYSGEAFRRALALTARAEGDEMARLRDRALAGAMRQQYPQTSITLMALWNETAAWLPLVESIREPVALCSAAERLGSASLALGRLLVATGHFQELDTLGRRVKEAGHRVRSVLPQETAGRKLTSRAAILAAMRGDGSPPFPQEARAKAGPKEVVARIEGELGRLSLTVETAVSGKTDGRLRMAAIPVLPVPGSLRVSPDGRSAAWLEIAGPSKLLPVIAPLDRSEPAREVAYLSSGRPLRDRGLEHVVASLSGYSKDGRRLGLSIEAWNDTPGPQPRYSVVAASTGRLIYETSTNRKRIQRLLD